MASDGKKTEVIFDCGSGITGRIDIRKDIPVKGFVFGPASFSAIFHSKHKYQFRFKTTCAEDCAGKMSVNQTCDIFCPVPQFCPERGLIRQR